MPTSRSEGKDVRIKCLVVWDTVSAVFAKKPVPIKDADLLGIPDSELPPNVELALHAMAFHENRRLFRATLFEPNNCTQLKEIWFPGAHADVGGGGKTPSDLPNISLLWVIGEMDKYLNISNGDLEYPDLSELTPTDAYHESTVCRRLLDKLETRLESKLLKSNSYVHETVAYLRNALPNSLDPRPKKPSYILTLQDLDRIQWDIKAYLVGANTLESLKRSASITRRTVKDQYNSIRASLSNIPIRTPRPSNAAMPSAVLRETNTPRPHASSVSLPNRQDKTASLVVAQRPSSRLRVQSHVPSGSQNPKTTRHVSQRPLNDEFCEEYEVISDLTGESFYEVIVPAKRIPTAQAISPVEKYFRKGWIDK
ncbi:hypothetical protein FRC07_002195, partial [Ceratobasidium sp. 392]